MFRRFHLPTISPGTRTRYEVDLRHRIEPFFAGMDLRDVDRLTLDFFRADIMKSLSKKSVNNCMSLLELLFNKATEWALLEKAPAKAKKLRLPELKYAWWDRKEYIMDFLAQAKLTRYYAAYLLALECGMRLGEIVGLGKKDIDLRRCQIHVHQQWLEAQGCLGPTKGLRARFFSFDKRSDLKPALSAAIRSSPHEHAIFVTRTGQRVRSTKIREKLFSLLVRRAGVPRIRFHDLRHTFASWYMIEHDDIWSLRQILGHADIQTTQRYAHLSPRHRATQTIIWSGDPSRR